MMLLTLFGFVLSPKRQNLSSSTSVQKPAIRIMDFGMSVPIWRINSKGMKVHRLAKGNVGKKYGSSY